MIHMLHKQSAFSDRFITYMLARNIRVEEDSSIRFPTQRETAARASSAGSYSKQDKPERLLPTSRRNSWRKWWARPGAGELFHEQVPQARVHRVQTAASR